MIGVARRVGGTSLGNKLKLESGFPKSAIIADSQLSRFGMKQRGASDTEPTAEQPQHRKKALARKRLAGRAEAIDDQWEQGEEFSAGYFN